MREIKKDCFKTVLCYIALDCVFAFYCIGGAGKSLCASNKKRLQQAVLFPFLYALDFIALQASRANVIVYDFSFFHEGNLLNVCLERSSRLTMAVADVVTRRLTFTANAAYSRHIDTSDGKFRKFFARKNACARLTEISYHFQIKKSIKKRVEIHFFYGKRKKFFYNACKI